MLSKKVLFESKSVTKTFRLEAVAPGSRSAERLSNTITGRRLRSPDWTKGLQCSRLGIGGEPPLVLLVTSGCYRSTDRERNIEGGIRIVQHELLPAEEKATTWPLLDTE